MFAETCESLNEDFNQWTGSFTGSSGLSEDFSCTPIRIEGDAKAEAVTGKFEKSMEDTSCYLGVFHPSAVTSAANPYIAMIPRSDFQTGENGVATLEFDFATEAFNNSVNPQINVAGHFWTTSQDLSGEAGYQYTMYDNYGKYEISGKVFSYLEIYKNCITVFGTEYPLLTDLSVKKWHRLSLKVYADNTYTLTVDDVLIALREEMASFSIRYRYKNTANQNVDIYRTTSYFRGFKEVWFQYREDKECTEEQGYYLDNVSVTTADADVQDAYRYPYCITGVETYGSRILGHGLAGGRTIQRIYLKKMKATQKPLQVLAALYRDGRLLDIAVSSFSDPKMAQYEDESLVLGEKLILPEDISGCSFKIMLWEDGVLTPLANVFSLDETSEASPVVYTQKGFSEPEAAAYAKGAVILRAGNHQCYVDNIRMSFQEGDSSVVAYLKNGRMYAPAIFMLNALDFENIAETDAGVTAYKNGTYCVLSVEGDGIGCEYLNGVLYADVKELAQAAGTGYQQAENVAIVSQSVDEDAKVPDDVLELICQRLAYRWNNVYLGSRGYVTGLVAHPQKTGLIYARTDVGGMYRYLPERGIWKQLMTAIPLEDENLLSVRSVALDPNDENVVYAACGGNDTETPADILKSVDQGENWVRLQFNHGFGGNQDESRLAGECLAVDPNDSDTVYCGTHADGFFVSRDAGVHWKQIASVPHGTSVKGGVSAVCIDAETTDDYGRSQNIYVAVWGEGIYVSCDGGDTFTELEDAPKLTCRMEKVDGKLYVSATDVQDSDEYTGGFFCLQNGVWKNLTPKAADGYTYTNAANAFMIDKNNHNMIYLNGAPYRQKALMRSTDGGESWEYLAQLFNASCLLQNPLDETGIWISYGAGIGYISNMYDTADNIHIDAANNEYCFDRGVEELVCEKVLSIPSEKAPLLLSQVMDFGMMKSIALEEPAEVCTPQIGNGSGIDYCEADPSIVLRTGIKGRVKDSTSTGNAAISDDYGNSFTTLSAWGTTPIIDCAVGAQIQENGYPILLILAATTTGTVEVTEEDTEKSGLYRSMDLGKTWEKLTNMPDYITNKWGFDDFRLAADRVDGNTFYYTNNGAFYVTTDGGDTWTQTRTFPKNANPFIKAVPGISGAVWYKAADGIYVSYDKGSTWSCLEGLVSPVSFGFGIGKEGQADKPAVYVAATINDVYGVYLSDDLGQSWRRINDDANGAVGYVNDITGDSRVYGRVFLSSAGAGVVYGQPIEESYSNP
ncbi:MAG: hypothetical protein U0L92_01280 [Clostridia bacterium]|nr:hypothetical protein [Clostridia bacterium]